MNTLSEQKIDAYQTVNHLYYEEICIYVSRANQMILLQAGKQAGGQAAT